MEENISLGKASSQILSVTLMANTDINPDNNPCKDPGLLFFAVPFAPSHAIIPR